MRRNQIAKNTVRVIAAFFLAVVPWSNMEPAAHAQSMLSIYRKLRMDGAGLTDGDMNVLHAKINMAIPYLQQVWRQIFAGTRSANRTPIFYAYDRAFQSQGCGFVKENNAEWCPANHTIYYDEIFLGQLTRAAAVHTGGDGDYAPIVVLAHEMGHAVASEMGVTRQISMWEESSADCMAGVVTYLAQRDGHLERDDIAEAEYALSLAADKPGLTYNQELVTPGVHGTAGQRGIAFDIGRYSGSVKMCMKDWPRR